MVGWVEFIFLNNSHLGSCALPEDLYAEGVLCVEHRVESLGFISLWHRRDGQRHRDLITLVVWIPDLGTRVKF